MDKENKELIKAAKRAANDGNLLESMKLFKKSYALYPSENTKEKMEKLQVRICTEKVWQLILHGDFKIPPLDNTFNEGING